MNKHLLLKMSSLVVVLMMFAGVLSAQAKPEILAENNLNFVGGSVCVGKVTTMEMLVLCENLQSDVSLISSSDVMTLSPTVIKKGQTEATINVTVAPKTIQDKLYGDQIYETITLKSQGIEDFKIDVSWWVVPTVASLAEAKTKLTYGYFNGIVEGEIVITKEFEENNNKYIYMQDENNAERCLIDPTLITDFKDNDHYKFNHFYYQDGEFKLFLYGDSICNEEVTPKAATIEELSKNPNEYANWLIKLTDVTFNVGGNFGGSMQIKQGESFMYADLFDGSGLAGVKIPKVADITGIFNGTQTISIRSKAEVVSKDDPTSVEDIENEIKVWSEDNMLMVELDEISNVEVYNTVGQRIDSRNSVRNYQLNLEDGVYLVRVNGEIYKTIVK